MAAEELEARDVPSTSPFFLAANNQLYAANDVSGQTYTATGGFGIQLSVGAVSPFGVGGGQFAVFRDGNNRVYLFNGNNNIFTRTNAFAIDVVAGRGEFFLRDGNNQVYVVTLGASLNGDGTFAVTPTLTAAYALEMSVGFDNATGRDFLAFRAGDNSVHALATLSGVPVYGFSGMFAIDIEAGNQRETFVRASDNRVGVATISAINGAQIIFQAPLQSAAFALEMSVGRGSPNGADILAFRAGDNSVNYVRYFPGTPSTVTYVSLNTFALEVDAGSNEIFTRDLNNQVVYYTINPFGTTVTTLSTGTFAIRLEVTRWSSSLDYPIDQLAIQDSAGRLFVSQNNVAGDRIASFFNTGFIADDIAGYGMNP